MKQHSKRETPRKSNSPNPAAAAHPTDHADSLGLERLVFFSDAVFAIAITLLALEIRLPVDSSELTNAELLNQLLALWPKYLSYCVSFLVIGNFWMNHHTKFRTINAYDSRLLLINLLMLMVIAFVPFPTSVLSESGNRTATIFYAATMATAGFLSVLVWWYAAQKKRFVPADFSAAEGQRRLLHSVIVPTIFLLSIGVAFIDADAAKYFWLLIIPASIL